MIKFITGDLLNSDAEALVNTVNTVGVMGKGIALQFKNRFPLNYKVYRDACKSGELTVGKLLIVKDGDLMNQKTIINFPTKAHWKGDSKYEYILSGLKVLREELIDRKIKSVAIPPLGCGNGGLDWAKIKPMIEEELKGLDTEIIVFEPNETIKALLQKQAIAKSTKLTPARAMLLYLMFNYESVGEQSSLFVANKLAYFLQRRGENLRLRFEAHHYGPYAVQLNHVLLNMNGVYLTGMEQNEAKPFEPLQLNYGKLDEVKTFIDSELSLDQKERLNDVISLLNRFESAFALELLATVDYVMNKEKTDDLDSIVHAIGSWSNRKEEMFDADKIQIAYKHLKHYSDTLFEFV
nr:macro domain-containing protein [uncultured Fluviicola sp.]